MPFYVLLAALAVAISIPLALVAAGSGESSVFARRREKGEKVDPTNFLLEGSAAAQVWSAVEMAQVILDQQLAYEQKAVRQPQVEYVYRSPRGAKLRLIKLASERDAILGDVVEFTLRYDNIGVEPIGNVTIVDNLTTRLEYVEDSQSCSLRADFLTQAHQHESLVHPT